MRMKWLSVLLLVLVIATSFVAIGCGNKTPAPTPTPTATTPATSTVAPSTGGGGDYWVVDYLVGDGSYLELNYSAAGMTPLHKTTTFNDSSNYTFKMKFAKEEVDGSREVIIPADDYHCDEFTVKAIMTGINMDLVLTLDHDAVGTLYTEDGVGDVDMVSESTSSASPIQVDTQGDGTMDPAGSMVIPIPLVGNFETSVGQDGSLVFGLTYTTGHTENTVHISQNKKMDGAFIEGDGVVFDEDSDISPAPYVGTVGTLTTTGTGDCLGIKLVGVRIDFQYLQVMCLKPVSITEE